MQVDKTTINDLSIFQHDEEQSVFHHLNFTTTNAGKEVLRSILSKPLSTIADIHDAQKTIQHLQTQEAHWQKGITNGTIMVIERFYDTPVSNYPSSFNWFNSFLYTLVNSSDYSLTKYSVQHCIGFVKGFKQIEALLANAASKKLTVWQQRIHLLLHKPVVQEMLQVQNPKILSNAQVLYYAAFLRNQFKYAMFELMDIYSSLDAYLSLAKAATKYHLSYPTIVESNHPFIQAHQLHHLLLAQPISYQVALTKDNNFLFLTGANMAGKSTFIKAVGICTYLAHIGMGVPAQNMQLSLFHGLLSNIHIMDNIVKGESYFFNEVQRIKSTIEKVNDGQNWLILIDELFKGTNVQDAMKCSTIVIEGLLKMNNAVFLLSTHLYEIAEELRRHSNIQFRYFETAVQDDQLVFSYQLKEGISNDRLGYLILKREGVVDLLEKL